MSEEQDSGNSAFERSLRQSLLAGDEALDGRTRSRLTQARHAALEHGGLRRGTRAWSGWAPAGVAASVVLAIVVYINQRAVEAPAAVAVNGSALDDLDLLADADALELNAGPDAGELDYDFYEWAAAAADAGDGLGT
jgi:hypothetical protein